MPSWARDVKVGNRYINARIETTEGKPRWRNAYRRRRCLLPADGYFAWMTTGPDGKTFKQPYTCTPGLMG